MENVEKQIVRIIENNSPELAAEEILRLFSIVGRSEQLVCVHPYNDVYQSDTECYCENCGKDLTEAN